jgi:hypothetical protein
VPVFPNFSTMKSKPALNLSSNLQQSGDGRSRGYPPAIRRLVWISALALVAFSPVTKVEAASRWETLEAIHAVENPSNSPRPGRFGELGAYQFRASTWRMYTRRPFSEATNRQSSDEVAVRHYEWLKTTLAGAGVEPSTYNIALAWNAGATAVITGRVPSSSHDYASRVDNLATALNSSAQVAMK